MRVNLKIYLLIDLENTLMKPYFDLKDPLVSMAVEMSKYQMYKALSIPQKVEDSVVPIFHTIKRKTKPDQIGSGVVVKLKDEYFIFSASHVFEIIGENQLLVGTCKREKLISLAGERFSTKKGISGSHRDDPIDASVFHIQSGITESLKEIAITIDDIDFEPKIEFMNIFMASGFRSKKSNTSGNEAKGKRECFPSVEYSEKEYDILNIDPRFHIALAFEDQIIINGKWQKSPKPKGMSGGAIIKACGLSTVPPFHNGVKLRQKLTAITIEQRREQNGKPGVLIGTRVGVHFGLIKQFLPSVL